MPYYATPIKVGIDHVASLGDGLSINIRWFKAYPTITSNAIAYNIYFSTDQDAVFSEGPKYVSIDESLEANIIDLVPGQSYWFSVRPVEYNPNYYDLSSMLPTAYDVLKFYPTSLLRQNISDTDLLIPLLDVEGFPSYGTIRIGYELIQYLSVDTINNNLVLTDLSQRGVNNTYAREHFTDGYDGYYYLDPTIFFFTVGESNQFDRKFVCQSRFEYPNFAFTLHDGYYQNTRDLLTSDLSASDVENVDFPKYDSTGYHSTPPSLLLNGDCVGSYIGGEQGCIDGYGNVNMVRGMSFQERNNQNQEILLETTGRPVVLLQRVQTGIVCSCYQPSSEYPDDRCPFCFGTKFVVGLNQYFNPRRSDGRILVRVGPTEETIKMYEAGMESEFPLDLWTLTVPTIKPRDVIVLYDIDGNEEFRYEVTAVTRNNTLAGMQGGQKFKAVRIRKTDILYQAQVFKDTSTMPTKVTTTVGFVAGIPPHTHTITRNENDPSTWNQLSSISQGHNHEVIFQNGELTIVDTLGHHHDIVI